MNKELAEIEVLLKDISDSYYDFVTGIMVYAMKKPERQKTLLDYLKNHPTVLSSEVVQFVSSQPDFFEDSIYPKKSKESIA